MKRIMIVVLIIAVIGLVAGSVYFGVIPGLGLFENGTDTVELLVGDLIGNENYELIGPNNRKGFICSYRENGMSEIIVARGKVNMPGNDQTVPWHELELVRYRVFLKENAWSSYELHSTPGTTSKYLSSPNPGTWDPDYLGYMTPYDFQIVGNKYSKGAIKVELWGFFDKTIWDSEGSIWHKLAVDEAYLYEGFGGLTFETDSQGLPINTYEIGETGRIHVETTYGGQTVGEENKPWEIIMRYPEDRGGGIFKQQTYGDMVKSYFEFDVTSDMFSKSSNNEYKITLYNTILPQAEIRTRTIDLKAKAPGDVVYSGETSVKNGNYIYLELSANVNAQTQLPISYFRVGVYYGSKSSTIPTDPLSERWIINVVDVYDVQHSGSKYYTNLRFIPDKPNYEGYICAWAVAYDTEGRGSLHSEKYVIYIWGESGEPPPETIEDEVGQDHDYGGHSENWLAWDPSGGNWEQADPFELDATGLIIAVAIIAVFAVIAFLQPYKNPFIIVSLIIAGVAIAIIQYIYFFM